MGDPLSNLLWFVGLGAAIAAIAWPRHGLVAWWRRQRSAADRILVEDALKHAYHYEDRGQTATQESIGGALEIPSARVVALVERMQDRGLVRWTDGRIVLTAEGGRYALQIIRAHRLWERYLADETGVHPLEWHAEAERAEHRMSAQEVENLDLRLGRPRFDPHGDPIPAADGSLPSEEPVGTLSDLAAGERAAVVHIEDEPHVVYAQLYALGFQLGTEVRVRERTDDRIVLEADGRPIVLAPLLAANVSTRRLPQDVAPAATGDASLAGLRPGETARVVRISPVCRGLERRRLMDFGIVPGTRIAFERNGMTGGLAAYRVRDTVVALREEQARMIAIEKAS